MTRGGGGMVVGGDAKYGELIRIGVGYRGWRLLPNGKREEREWKNQRRQDVEREFKEWHDEGKSDCKDAEEKRKSKRAAKNGAKTQSQVKPVKDWIVQVLDAKNVEYCDRRSHGGGGNGNLWVFGAEQVPGLIDSLAATGAQFTYRDNAGKQFGYRSAWWLKGYPELQVEDEKISPQPDTEEEGAQTLAPVNEELRDLALLDLYHAGWSQDNLAPAFGLTVDDVTVILGAAPMFVPEPENKPVDDEPRAETEEPTKKNIAKVFGVQIEKDGKSSINKAFLTYEEAFNAVDAAMEAVKLFDFDDPRPDITEIEIIS